MERRNFLVSAFGAGALAVSTSSDAAIGRDPKAPDGCADRRYMVDLLAKMATPILAPMSQGRLQAVRRCRRGQMANEGRHHRARRQRQAYGSPVSARRQGGPGEGNTSEADSVAVNAPAPNVLLMSLSQNQVLGSARAYAISADGKKMTESAANVDNRGAPFVRNFHFKRVR